MYPSAEAALAGLVRDGQLLAVGGFGLCGIPEALIDAAAVEVEQIVQTGSLDPDEIHLSAIYVHRLVLNANPEKRIERRTGRQSEEN